MRLDGHAHVFLKDLPMAPGRRYTPATDASPETYFAYLRQHRLDGAVLVQPSFLGNDISYLLEVLDKYRCAPNGLSLFGVCMAEPTISRDQIHDLKARGIIGIRLNCVKRELPDLRSKVWRSFATRIHDADWHLELHIEPDRLLNVLDILPPDLNTVVDHFCLAGSETELSKLLARAVSLVNRESLFVKTSAPYRLPEFDDDSACRTLAPALAEVLKRELGAKQLIWGSDWPFTQHETLQDYETSVSQGKRWLAGEPYDFATFPERLLGYS